MDNDANKTWPHTSGVSRKYRYLIEQRFVTLCNQIAELDGELDLSDEDVAILTRYGVDIHNHPSWLFHREGCDKQGLPSCSKRVYTITHENKTATL